MNVLAVTDAIRAVKSHRAESVILRAMTGLAAMSCFADECTVVTEAQNR